MVDGYTLPFAVLLLTAGTLGDRFGRKRLFLLGLAVFSLGSAFCGFAPGLGWLIAGRVLQGVGGAALAPGSLSLIASAFTDPRERIQALGLWAGISGIAIAAGDPGAVRRRAPRRAGRRATASGRRSSPAR